MVDSKLSSQLTLKADMLTGLYLLEEEFPLSPFSQDPNLWQFQFVLFERLRRHKLTFYRTTGGFTLGTPAPTDIPKQNRDRCD